MLSAMRTQVRHSGCPVPCDFPFSISQLHPNLRIILAFVTSRIVEFFLQVWSYLSIWGPPKLPPSPSKNRKNKSTINNVGWPRHALTNGVRRFWFLKILFWGLRIQCVEKIWNNNGYISSFSMCCSAGMDFPPLVYRTRHYHLSCDTHSYRLPLVRMSCHTSHLANAGVQNVNKCDKWRTGARRILWRFVWICKYRFQLSRTLQKQTLYSIPGCGVVCHSEQILKSLRISRLAVLTLYSIVQICTSGKSLLSLLQTLKVETRAPSTLVLLAISGVFQKKSRWIRWRDTKNHLWCLCWWKVPPRD